MKQIGLSCGLAGSVSHTSVMGLHTNHLAELPGQVNSWKEKWLTGMKYTLLVAISTKATRLTVRLR